MRSKISRKLIVTNILIVVFALAVFCVVISLIYSDFTRSNIKKQLFDENEISLKFAQIDPEYNKSRIYNILTDSVTLIYSVDDDGYSLLSISDKSFQLSTDINENINSMINEQNGEAKSITINSKDYLFAESTGQTVGQTKENIRVISLISVESVNSVIEKFIISLILVSAVLGVISAFIMLIVSKKITGPIAKITQLTKEYSKRNFDNKYIANTGDELEELSVSINDMASSLKEHDTQRDRLFRHISHEIKTPLTAISGYAEGLKSDIFEDRDTALDIIMSESLRIKKLTEDMVFLSKLESSIEVFDFKVQDILPVVERSIKSVESIAILRDIDIVYQPINLTHINFDADKVFRALVNILSNAIKYTKDTVEIELSETDDSVAVTVRDNGAGFDVEAVNNLLSGMTKEKNDGSGIGLSIVNRIIVAHGGSFDIGNSQKGGAVCKITFKKIGV